jgi:hypothetical protein
VPPRWLDVSVRHPCRKAQRGIVCTLCGVGAKCCNAGNKRRNRAMEERCPSCP